LSIADNIQIFIYKRPGCEAKSGERLKIEDNRAEKRALQSYRLDAESFSSQIDFHRISARRKNSSRQFQAKSTTLGF
jgi:hypothetical protein